MNCLAGFARQLSKLKLTLEPPPEDQTQFRISVACELAQEYSLGEIVGAGSFGTVFMATEKRTGDSVAVKAVSRRKSCVALVTAEASFLKGLSHPNVLNLRRFHRQSRHAFLVMDMYPGGDLIQGVQRFRRKGTVVALSEELVCVAQQMVEAVRYIHSKFVIHRDIKPDNFLLSSDNILASSCQVVLGDFGLARVLEDENQRLKDEVGTRLFWAPEHFDNDYGLKVDVWALGATIYTAVLGKFPFGEEALIREREAFYPEHLRSTACQECLQFALTKDETRRPTADELSSHPWLSQQRNVVAKASEACETPSTTFSAGAWPVRSDIKGCNTESTKTCSSVPTSWKGAHTNSSVESPYPR